MAVAAGLLSFLSPCVLPLVPAYLGQLTAVALVGRTADLPPSRGELPDVEVERAVPVRREGDRVAVGREGGVEVEPRPCRQVGRAARRAREPRLDPLAAQEPDSGQRPEDEERHGPERDGEVGGVGGRGCGDGGGLDRLGRLVLPNRVLIPPFVARLTETVASSS